MNNLNNSLKKFLGNKNTVTILGILICLAILFVGYNARIQQRTALTKVPYAKQTIQPKTEITSAMVGYMTVPASFLVGSYYKGAEEIVGKYSNYNTIIAEGSLFYTDLVVSEDKLPDSSFMHVPDNYTLINYNVDMNTTYANSMMPKSYINIYFKGTNDKGEIMFGKFISNIEILDVKDGNGRHVFENTEEARTPAYMLFAIPEDMHLLFRKALYLRKGYNVELLLIPNTVSYNENFDPNKTVVEVSSKDIKEWIEDKTEMVDVTTILTDTESAVNGSENKISDNNTNKNN